MDAHECKNFVLDVLKQFYKEWEPSDLEITEWCKKLRYYNYQKAKNIVGDFVFSCSIAHRTPPAGKIISAFKKAGAELPKEALPKTEPYILFGLARSPKAKVYMRWASHILPSAEECENSAKKMSYKCEQLYGGKFIIMREWEKYFNTDQPELL